jgi:F-type H+-transporting ATPase subunit epsilon
MNLKALLPTGVLIEEEVTKVIAEAHNGFFCLLPKHVDFAAAIVPGILSFETAGGREEFLAVDQGILIKCGQEVLVSTRNAVRGPDLGQLRRTVEERFKVLDDREKTARSAMVKIEAGFVRRFLEIQGHG